MIDTIKIDIHSFKRPLKSSIGLLSNYNLGNTNEVETLLTFMLDQNINNGEFSPVQCKNDHSDVVKIGLVDDCGNLRYSLTKRAIIILYLHFGSVDVP